MQLESLRGHLRAPAAYSPGWQHFVHNLALSAGRLPQVHPIHGPREEPVLRQPPERAVRDEHAGRVALVHLLEPARYVRVLAHDAVLHPRMKAHVAYEDPAGVHAAPNLDLRKVPRRLPGPFVHPLQRVEHAQRGADPGLGVVLVRQRRAVDREHGIADELEHHAAMVVNDLRHVVEVAAEQQQRALWRHALDDCREGGDVREEDCHLDLVDLQVRLHVRPQQDLDNWPGHILAPRLDGLLHVLEGSSDQPHLAGARLVGICLLAVGHSCELQLRDALHLIS
mmetsp:Transcript_81417/g.211665  ORF Transcript_81417/g.211665 Transcript_81417/m.211665 type:complete len:282 (-) Transcript_81417:1462-2307(-)